MRPTGQLCILSLTIFATTGCTGTGRVSVVSTNLKKLPSSGPLIRTLDAGRCYYWVEDAHSQDSSSSTKRLCIAMESDSLSNYLGKSQKKMMMSLVLPDRRNRSEHTYPVNRQSLRMIQHSGYSHSRWASLTGLVSIHRKDDSSISGRFRIAAKQQSFLITTGWSGKQRALLVGEFSAVHNPEKGRRIIEATEADGMSRTKRKKQRTPPDTIPPR